MPVIDIREVDLVLHRQFFKEEHNGYMNMYACENQVDCVRCVAAVKDTATHKASSQDIYTELVYFVSFPVLMYEICFKVLWCLCHDALSNCTVAAAKKTMQN
jgi:hypothetical protein